MGEGRGAAALFGTLLVLGTLVCYVPALRAGFVWDDDFYVTDNDTLRDTAGLARIWTDPGANPQYYPLTFTTFWIERRLWGLAPAGYHLTNVLLHAGTALLLWRVLRTLRVPGSAFAAALFAVHPLQVESVAWVTERKNALSGTLALAAALLFLRHSFADDTTRPGSRRRFGLTAAFVLFAGALLAKSVVAFLPVALALAVAWRKGSLPRRDLMPLAGMLALGAASGLFTAHLERVQVGAAGQAAALSLVERFVLAGRIFWFYPGKLAWPSPLAFQYPRWIVNARSVAQWAFPLAALLCAAGAVVLRRRLGAGILVALAAYTVAIAPVLGFLDVFPMKYSWVADHFQYLAGIALLALAAAGGALLARRLRARTGSLVPERLAAGLVLSLLAVATYRQCRAYRDLESLWRDTTQKYPDTWMAQYNLAVVLDEQGRREEAARHLEQAIAVHPDYPDALNNLGAIRLDAGRRDEAKQCFERALAVDPGHVFARYNLAAALASMGREPEAIAQLEETLRRTPDPSAVANQISGVLARRGYLGPPAEATHAALAGLLARVGRIEEAVRHYRKVTELRPDLPDPWLSLGRLFLDQGDLDDAVASFEQAVQVDGKNERAHLLLEQAYQRIGRRP